VWLRLSINVPAIVGATIAGGFIGLNAFSYLVGLIVG